MQLKQKNARKLIKEKFDYKKISNELILLLNKVIPKSSKSDGRTGKEAY